MSNNLTEHELELQVVTKTYDSWHQRLQTSLETINQTLSLYIGVITFLTAFATGLLGISSQLGSQQNSFINLGLAALSLVASIATYFTLIRSFQARMELTDAERALCRLRYYFVTKFPDLQKYLSGPINDDWPTPYTNQWRSSTFYGWLTLIFVTGFLFGLSTYLSLLALNLTVQLPMTYLIPILFGFTVSTYCYRWLNTRLHYRRISDQPRFPLTKQVVDREFNSELREESTEETHVGSDEPERSHSN